MNEVAQGAFARDDLREAIKASLHGKAKPVRSLGRLEDLALQLGLIAKSAKPNFGKAAVLVFAGDHGLTAEGITAYPSAVTHEVAKLILAGHAGINVLARATNLDVRLVDCGLLQTLSPHAMLTEMRLGAGTRNSRSEPAMTDAEFDQAIANGRAIDATLGRDIGIAGYGEIGIGNSSAASMLAHAVTGIDLATLVGPGAGAPPGGVAHKLAVLSDAVARIPLATMGAADRASAGLRHFGGFEMATMAGAMIAAATRGRVIVVDGFISTAVAIAAAAVEPAVIDNCVFAHCSAEPGHRALLDFLRVRPLLELDMRLGEGTGAALAIPIVRAAELMLREMADLRGEHPEC